MNQIIFQNIQAGNIPNLVIPELKAESIKKIPPLQIGVDNIRLESLDQLGIERQGYNDVRSFRADLFKDIINDNLLLIPSSELSSISFNQLMESPRKINDLFSNDLRELVDNLVFIQNEKIGGLNPLDLSTSEGKIFGLETISNFQDTNTNPQILPNQLSNNSVNISKTHKEKLEKRNLQDEIKEKPYFDKKKKSKKEKKLSKLLSSIAKGLDKISNEIKLLAN